VWFSFCAAAAAVVLRLQGFRFRASADGIMHRQQAETAAIVRAAVESAKTRLDTFVILFVLDVLFGVHFCVYCVIRCLPLHSGISQ